VPPVEQRKVAVTTFDEAGRRPAVAAGDHVHFSHLIPPFQVLAGLVKRN
jgi:hypothetical protein